MFNRASSLALALAASGTAAQSFVTVQGEHFNLDGKDFVFAGSNAYYWPFSHVCQLLSISEADEKTG